MKKENLFYQKIRAFAGKFNPFYVLIVFLLPLFFINIHEFTDWGDDFALYLHQAKNIAEGISPQKTGLIYNPDNPIMISNVSVCFSLLLVPVYLIFGLNFKAFSLLITFFLFLAAIVIFYFLKHYIPVWLAVMMVLLLVYHRWTLDFKQYILSDIPFVVLFFAILYSYVRISKKSILTACIYGLLVAFMLNVRSVGIVFILGLLCETAFLFIKHFKSKLNAKEAFSQLVFTVVLIVVALGTSFIIKKIAFPEPQEGGYISYFKQHNLYEIFLTNINQYFNWFRWFFTFKKIALVVQYSIFYIFLVFVMTGMIKKLKQNFNIIDYCFFIFLAIILIYPANPGFRYLFPLMPFFFLYFYFGSVYFSKLINSQWVKISYFLPVIMLLLSYPGLLWHIETKDYPVGTEQKSVREVFNFISSNTPDNSVIVFRKPRALSLYTGRYGLANNGKEKNTERLDYLYKKFKVSYLLQNNVELADTALILYLDKYPDKCEPVFSNDKFSLYQLKQ